LRKESEYGENEMQYRMFFFFYAYVLRVVMGGLYYCIGCFARCVVDVWKWG